MDSSAGTRSDSMVCPQPLAGVEARVAGDHGQHAFLSGTPPRQVFRQVSTGENVVIVSEPFANKHVSAAVTRSRFLWDQGWCRFVYWMYFDYASERGYILTDRRTMLKYLPDPAPSNLALYLKPGVDLEEGRRAIQAAIGDRRIFVLSNRYLREQGIRIFDRTFAITYALEAVAILWRSWAWQGRCLHW